MLQLAFLSSVVALGDPEPVVQYNFEQLEEAVYLPTVPTRVGGVANTVIGPPTTGAHLLNERWVDSKGAEWICTAAGTPGTWKQSRPALMAADPVAGTYPAGYRIWRTDLFAQRITVAGGTPGTWVDWIGSRDVTVVDGKNIVLGTGTGTKIGTAAGQKLAFFGVDPIVQYGALSGVAGGATVDAEARAAIAEIQDLLTDFGFAHT